MTITPHDLIAIIFGAFNILRLVSYVPQIIAVARDRHGAPAISVSCWAIWIGANVSTGLYAWTHLCDLGIVGVSVLNAAGCTTILSLAVFKRCMQAQHRGRIVTAVRDCIRRNFAFVKYRAIHRPR